MVSIFTILLSCHIIYMTSQECEISVIGYGDLIYKGLKDGCEEIKGLIEISNTLPSPYHEKQVF